jgi:hypothetical protein
MSESFSKEYLRVEELLSYLEKLLPAYGFRSSKPGECVGDFIVSWPKDEEGPPLMIIKVTNEAGLSGDAGIQGTTYYAKEVAKEGGPMRSALSSSFSPCVFSRGRRPPAAIQRSCLWGGGGHLRATHPMLSLLDLHGTQPEQV